MVKTDFYFLLHGSFFLWFGKCVYIRSDSVLSCTVITSLGKEGAGGSVDDGARAAK